MLTIVVLCSLLLLGQALCRISSGQSAESQKLSGKGLIKQISLVQSGQNVDIPYVLLSDNIFRVSYFVEFELNKCSAVFFGIFYEV